MAIVLALVIIGWLVAFALGAQAGFDNSAVDANPSAQPSTASPASRESASAA